MNRNAVEQSFKSLREAGESRTDARLLPLVIDFRKVTPRASFAETILALHSLAQAETVNTDEVDFFTDSEACAIFLLTIRTRGRTRINRNEILAASKSLENRIHHTTLVGPRYSPTDHPLLHEIRNLTESTARHAPITARFSTAN